MVPKSSPRPWLLDFTSLASINTGIQKARRWFQVWYSRINHGSKTLQFLRRTYSICRPLQAFIRLLHAIRSYLSQGNHDRVLPPSQQTISCQHMRSCPPWKTTTGHRCCKYTDAWAISSQWKAHVYPDLEVHRFHQQHHASFSWWSFPHSSVGDLVLCKSRCYHPSRSHRTRDRSSSVWRWFEQYGQNKDTALSSAIHR